MSTLLVALLLLPLAQAQNGAPAGNAQTGKALWEGPDTACRNCHGPKGEGAYGPDLAGRQLSVAQFTHAVRTPWGVMHAFTEKQISEQNILDLLAYFGSLPRMAEPGPWRTPVPPGAPTGQQLLIATAGCGQCHGAVLGGPRAFAGGVATDANFEWFKKLVYEHTATMPVEHPHMGNFSRARLPEPLLQEIWRYASVDLGLRVPLRAQVSAGAPAGNGVTYSLTVENRGTPGKGLTAEDISISLTLPSGATVVTTTGAGYQGVRSDPQTSTNLAVWQVPRIAPADKQIYTITLSGNGASAGISRGVVRWTKPALGGGAADNVPVAPPPPPQASAQ